MSANKNNLFSKEIPNTPVYHEAKTFWRTMVLLTPIGYLYSALYYFRYNGPEPALIILGVVATCYTVYGLIKVFPALANKVSIYFGFMVYALLFWSMAFYTGGISGNGPYFVLSTVFVAYNFINKKELIYITLACAGLIWLMFIPAVSQHIIQVVPPEQMQSYRLASQMALTIIVAITGFYSLKNQEKNLKEKEEAIHAANQSSNLASLGEMAGGIAHEINNPLMIITGSAMVIDKLISKQVSSVESEKIKKHIETINKTTKRAANIIKGLKNLARDGINDEKEDVTIASVLEDIMSFMENKMAHSNIKFSYEKDTPMFNKTFSLYRVQFSQVLLNLITNSYYAVDELEEKWINVEMEEKGNQYIIRVTDSGKGIPKEHQDKIFTPFFTTKPVGKGTGLGLPLCHNIMKTSGGDLYLDKDHPNTSFVIVLPAQDFIKDYQVEAA